MKHFTAAGLSGIVLAGGAWAADAAFSKTVHAEDFAAAGLGKLTPEELVRLDGLVREHKESAGKGKLKPASERSKETKSAPAVAAPVAEKVRVAPGTVVEVGDVESRIVGDFTGWSGRAVLALENGQRWQVANGGSYYTPKLVGPKVKITAATLGGYWMTIEGVSTRVRVLPIEAK